MESMVQYKDKYTRTKALYTHVTNNQVSEAFSATKVIKGLHRGKYSDQTAVLDSQEDLQEALVRTGQARTPGLGMPQTEEAAWKIA